METGRTTRKNTAGAISVSEIPVPAACAEVPAFSSDELTCEELRELEDFMKELFDIIIHEQKNDD